MIRKQYNLFLDYGLIESIVYRHETDSLDAYVERLIIADQKQQVQRNQNIVEKVLTYAKKSLG